MRKLDLVNYIKQVRLLKNIKDYGSCIPCILNHLNIFYLECLLEIYDKVRKLQFSEEPNYSEYIRMIDIYLGDKKCIID